MPTSDAQMSAKQGAGVKREPFEKRLNYMKTEFAKWVPALTELSLYLNPTRGRFNSGIPNSGAKIDHTTVIDSHARRRIRDLASGMISGSTSPSRPWFKLGLPDKDLEQYKPVREYLDECARRMHATLADSNAYESLHVAYEEIATFGTSSMLILEDYRDTVRFRNFTSGEYFLSIGPDGRVNGIGRQFWAQVGALVSEFGIDNVSPSVKSAYETNSTQGWIKVNHLIEVNDTRIPGYADFRNMPYRSVYWEEGSSTDTFLRRSGFEEFPCVAPRWSTTSATDIYGYAPGWDVLGDDKMLQTMQIQKLMALDKAINPPMQADSSVQGSVNTLPGGVTRFSALLPNAGLKPAYQIAPDINAMREDILEVKKALDDSFFNDLFRMMIEMERSNVTATEIAEKQSEKLNMLSPVIAKLNNEQNNPMIDRVFNIMNRNGQLPELSEELEELIGGMPMKVTYVSIFAQAQKMIGITAIEQNLGFGLNIAGKTGDASVLDNYDLDETIRIYADSIGVPAKTMNDAAIVAAKRKERAEAAAKQAQADAMTQMIEGAAKGAKAAKDLGTTPVGANSALDAAMAGITGAQP
jgi:hypothetical protein